MQLISFFLLLGNNTLMITGAEGADSGSYRCEAVNLLGDSSGLLSIVVEGKFNHDHQHKRKCRCFIVDKT